MPSDNFQNMCDLEDSGVMLLLAWNDNQISRNNLPKDMNGEGNGNPLQYSCLENPMDKGAW